MQEKNSNDKTKDISTVNIDKVSKMILNWDEVKNLTTPNAMVTGSIKAIGVNKICSMDIPKWLLSHPAVERGIEFKCNRMIRQLDKFVIANNIIPFDDSDLAKDAANEMAKILMNTANQPLTWIKQLVKDTMRFGDNYFVLMNNKLNNKVLRWELQNPIFFSPTFEEKGGNAIYPLLAMKSGMVVNYDIDPKTKKPKSYTQLAKCEGKNLITSSTSTLKATGKSILAKKVVQLNLDRIGDDPFGIPIAYTLWGILKDIIRVERASSDTMVAFGTNRWIASTQFRTTEKMKGFAKSIGDISKSSTVILPEGVTLDNIKPGSTEFNKVHDMLMKLIAMRLGITLLQLEGTGADINKSTLDSIMKDVRSDFFADELEVESAIDDGFIKSCIINYNLKGNKIKNFPYPRFSFSEIEEDKDDKANRLLKQSLTVRNFAVSINSLVSVGMKDFAIDLANYLKENFITTKNTQKDFVNDNDKKKESIRIEEIDEDVIDIKKKPDTSNPTTITGMSKGA